MERAIKADYDFEHVLAKGGESGTDIIETAARWLESEDSPLEILFGTSLCLLAVLYFFARALQMLL